MRTISLGLLGCGNVGSGFVQLLDRNREWIRQRHGFDLHLARIGVKDRQKPRNIDLALVTDDAAEVINGDCRIIVELVGGTTAARSYVAHSLGSRKHVVTANKALLATAGADLHELAETHRVSLEFEASVCGAIPIVRVLRGALAGSRVQRIDGILNGTCNYILTRMEDHDMSYEDALRMAQEQGFAERDPTLDVSGTDAAQKLTILSRLAFGSHMEIETDVRGIDTITHRDLTTARKLGKRLRLTGSATLRADRVSLRVGPELLESTHPLSRVRDETNGIVIIADGPGEIALYGRGAGALPTAASVLADVIEVAGRC